MLFQNAGIVCVGQLRDTVKNDELFLKREQLQNAKNRLVSVVVGPKTEHVREIMIELKGMTYL